MWVTIRTSKGVKNLKIKIFADFKQDMLKFFLVLRYNDTQTFLTQTFLTQMFVTQTFVTQMLQ
jgi:hypothetical protein